MFELNTLAMALGIPGTGPHGQMRTLQQEIKNWQYAISLIDQGVKTRVLGKGKKQIEGFIEENKKKIKAIRKELKKPIVGKKQ